MAPTFYKIRRKGTTDQFSTGGATPKWSKTGKTWNHLGHVKSHLRQVNPSGQRGGFTSQRVRDRADYSEAEVVTFEAVPVDAEDVSILLNKVRAKKAEERRKAQEAARKTKEDGEKAELRRLKALYPEG